MSKMIEVKNLIKTYKDVVAVNDISFDVEEGELFAFLGINGAGKSTTINMITGNLDMDSGSIIVDKLDVQKDSLLIKKEIGVVFQDTVLDVVLSAYDNLYYRGKLYGLDDIKLKKRINDIARDLDFVDFLNKPLNKLSGGQKRKIDLARALIHEPKIVVLDEPTTGLDPKTRKYIWNYLNSLRKKGELTIFLTTHYMEEAGEADKIVIIDEGKIITKGTPIELKQKYAKDYLKIYKNSIREELFEKVLIDYSGRIKDENEYYIIEIDNTTEAKNIIKKYFDAFEDFEVYKGSMDDVFLKVTGKDIGEK